MEKHDITLTFFLKNGSDSGNAFKGTFLGPSDKPSQWQLLTRDQDLKDIGVKMFVFEYVETKYLPDGYDVKVKSSPHLDLKFADDVTRSISYPADSHFTAAAIKSWIISSIPTLNSTLADVVIKVSEKETIAVPMQMTTVQSTGIKQKDVAPDNEDYRESYVGYVVGGGLLFAVFAAAGVVLGSVVSDVQRTKPAEVRLVTSDAEIHDAENWDEKAPGGPPSTPIRHSEDESAFQEFSLLGDKPNKTF